MLTRRHLLKSAAAVAVAPLIPLASDKCDCAHFVDFTFGEGLCDGEAFTASCSWTAPFPLRGVYSITNESGRVVERGESVLYKDGTVVLKRPPQ